MSYNRFGGWENIDGSSVKAEEIEASFTAVMQKAKEIESTYLSRVIKEKAARLKKLIATAAVITLLILSPFAVRYYLNEQDTPFVASNKVAVARGKIHEITLPDGSNVILNAGSLLSWGDDFGSERRIVHLEGEALFDVTADKSLPFVVRTDNITVTAYGTVFNVCDYPSDPTASATLHSGVIGVKKDKTDEITINPNQTLTLEKKSGAITVRKTNADEMTSWTKGGLCLISMPLEQILKNIERKFDVTIHMTTGKYDHTVLTAKFVNDETLEELMKVLCQLIPGMTYRIDNNNVYIK